MKSTPTGPLPDDSSVTGIRITWPGVALGTYTHTHLPSATMRSPSGSVKRIARWDGRCWTNSPRAVTVVPVSGLVRLCSNEPGPSIPANRRRPPDSGWRSHRAVLAEGPRGIPSPARRPPPPGSPRAVVFQQVASRGLPDGHDGSSHDPWRVHHPATNRGGDRPQLAHQLGELARVERLRSVRQRPVRRGMDLDENAVGARGYRGPRHWRHLVAKPGAVARVRDDREMRQIVNDRDSGQVEHVADCRIEAPDPALAQNDLVVALGEHVLGAHEQIVDRRRHATLEENRLADSSDDAQERVVLHVACTDLDAIGDLRHQIRAVLVHRLGDDRQAGLAAGDREQLQTAPSQPLKRI